MKLIHSNRRQYQPNFEAFCDDHLAITFSLKSANDHRIRLISEAPNIDYIIAKHAFLTVVVPPYNSSRTLSFIRFSLLKARACSISGDSIALLTA